MAFTSQRIAALLGQAPLDVQLIRLVRMRLTGALT
jgi:hypothetical protein